MSADAPKNLRDLLAEVQDVARNDDGLSKANALLKVLRTYHYWPALQVKKFFKEPNLVLLHNTYKRVDVDHFQELYNECRSVILDMAAPEGENIIVTFANSIFDRMNDKQYAAVKADSDVCEPAYEGTVVTVYYYNNRWYFGTTSCPSVDSSRYFHPTKSHGDMFNEALCVLFPGDQDTVRERFTQHLNPDCAYAFTLVHHENRHVMDYTTAFGEGYAKLVHISTKHRKTLEDIPTQGTFPNLEILTTRPYPSVEDAMQALQTDPSIYALIVTKEDGRRIKVSLESVIKQEECDLGNPNKWHNMLWLYMQNNKNYQIVDYQRDYAPDLELPVGYAGAPLAPTYLIHTAICNMRDVLYNLYRTTTTYNPVTNRFKMNKQLDETYHPMMRFHLAQLRHIQVSDHANRYITPKSVYDYLCHHHTLKNVRMLIKFFAETPHFFKPHIAECFTLLNAKLSDKP